MGKKIVWIVAVGDAAAAADVVVAVSVVDVVCVSVYRYTIF